MAFRDALKEVYRQPVQAYRAFGHIAGARSLEYAIQDLQTRPEGFGALRSVPRKAGLGLFTVADTTAARAAASRLGWVARAQAYAERNVPSEADCARMETMERETAARADAAQPGSLPDQAALERAGCAASLAAA